MAKAAFGFLGLLLVLAEKALLVIQGASTPSELTALTQHPTWLPPDFSLLHCPVSNFAKLEELLPRVMGVIDATATSVEHGMLAGICEENHVPHIVLGYISNLDEYEWSYYVTGRKSDLADALHAVAGYFNWTKLNIATDENIHFGGIAALLEQQIERTYERQNFMLHSQEQVESAVGKGMRLSGNRVSVILTAPETTENILISQYRMSIGGEGFGNLISLYSSLYVMDVEVPTMYTGNLILAESEFETVSTVAGLYTQWLTSAVRLFANYSEPSEVKKSLDLKFPSHKRAPVYSLVNIQSGARVLVGQVTNNQVTITDSIIFLGNTTEIPQNAKSPLPISGNFGMRNVATMSTTAHNYYRGALLAVDQVNSWPNLLENFQLELFNFTAGVTVWNYDFAYNNVYPYRDKLGLAVLSGTSSGVTMKLISMLDSFGFKGPIIGSSNTVDALSDRRTYPTFVRTVLPDKYMTAVYLQMFKKFGWKNCGLFVSNETWGLGFRSAFSTLAKNNGISILNSEPFQVLPTPIPTIDLLRNYSANFLDFINTKARVLIIVINNNAVFLIDYLHELGLREGDVEIVANEWLTIDLFHTNDTEKNRKRSEILRGAVQFSPVSYMGAFGAKVKTDYIAKYGNSPPVYGCFFYDSALAIAYALDLAIRNGRDYMNSTVVLKFLRGSRFVGCTGTVTFDPDTNDRSPMPYNVLNAQFGENDTYVTNITTVGLYDPGSSVLFRFYSDVIWCDGTTNVPLDMRYSTIGCPFEDRFDREFPKGKYLLWGICGFIGLITVIFTGVIWRLAWNRPLEVLTEKHELEVNDVIVMAGIAVELVQYLSIGPNLSFTGPIIEKIESSTTLNIESFASYLNGGYNLVWIGVVSLVAASLLSGLFLFFNVFSRLTWFPCCEIIEDIAEIVLPLIGTWLFLPIISVLMDTYSCIRGTAPIGADLGFTDSYMKVDCYESCWQGKHLVHVVGSSVSLLIYTPLAILLRPKWQELQSPLHIKTLPFFLMVKTVLQISLIILNKTVKHTNSIAHVFIYLGFMTLFLLFSLKFQCYGYKRPQMWHVLSLVAVIFPTLLVIIDTFIEANIDILLLALLLCGWGFLGMGGFVYQILRIPSLLYRKKGIDTRSLFKFAFRPATKSLREEIRATFQAAGRQNRVFDSLDRVSDYALPTVNNFPSQAAPATTSHGGELLGLS